LLKISYWDNNIVCLQLISRNKDFKPSKTALSSSAMNAWCHSCILLGHSSNDNPVI